MAPEVVMRSMSDAAVSGHVYNARLIDRKITDCKWPDGAPLLPPKDRRKGSNIHTTTPNATIVDIGGSSVDQATLERLKTSIIHSKLRGERVVLPDELLYDDVGLQLWSDIIHLPDYYQFHDEVAILKQYGAEIADCIPNNAVLVDLGAGDTAKVSHLITALTAAGKLTTYLALDIARTYLGLNIRQLAHEHPTTPCHALWGTFANGMEWIGSVSSPRVFLSLGSVLCNDAHDTALRYLRSWAGLLRQGDMILIGMDGHTGAEYFQKIWRSYHHDDSILRVAQDTDEFVNSDTPFAKLLHTSLSEESKILTDVDSGIEIDLAPSEDTHFVRFWENGFAHANRLVGEEWFKLRDWSVHGLVEKEPSISHRFIFRAEKDITLGSTGVVFKRGDEMDWFDAHKYGPNQVVSLCKLAGLEVMKIWKAPDSEMRSYLVGLPIS